VEGSGRFVRVKIFSYLHQVTAPTRTRLAWFDLIEIGLVAFGFLLYFLVRGAVVDRDEQAIENAFWIIDLQESLGLFIEPQVNDWTLDSNFRVRFFNFVYFWLDFPLIIGIGLLMFWRQRTSYTLLRDALLISGGFALLMYWSFPVAPPRLLPELGFVDTLEQFDNLSYQAQSMAPFVNPYAAVPSLHVGWSLIVLLVVFWATPHALLRVGAFVLLVLQSVAVVATANHYIFDGVVGGAVSLPALGVAVWLQRRGYPALRCWLHARLLAAQAAGAKNN
jgi:PAP2 superfamily protein